MSDSHTASLPDLRREWVIEGIRSPQAQKDIEHALAALPELRYARLNLTNRRLTTEWAKQGQSAAVLPP